VKIGIVAVTLVLIALAAWAIAHSHHEASRAVLVPDNAGGTGHEFSLGSASIAAPEGWRQTAKADDKLVLRSPDGQQQLTLSILVFKQEATFEDFKRLCAHHLEAERHALSDGFIEPESPEAFQNAETFGMFYSGGDQKDRRMFTTYLSLKGNELLTVYLEEVDIAPEVHANTFKQIFATLKR